MEQPKITLAIFGNQNSNSGFQPLFWINNPPQQLENLVPPGMEENSYFFVLQTAPAFTQYTLIQNHVSSYMSSRAGVLKMAICIPAGYKLADNESPMTVLLGIREKFIETCMTQKSALIESYNFKEKLVGPEEFITILDAYTLIPSASAHRPMTGTDDALLLLSQEKTAELFKDIHYPQFTAYRQIVVAPTGNSATYKHVISGIDIPRRTQLQLVVNGHPEKWPVADYHNEVTTVNLNLNKRCWEYSPVSFTVNELLNHPISNPAQGHSVHIDLATESVVCTITPRKKVVTIQVLIEGCPTPTDVFRSLTIQAGPRRTVMNISPQGTFQLMGDDIIYLSTRELKPVLTNSSYTIVGTSFTDNVMHIAVQANTSATSPAGPVPPTPPQQTVSQPNTAQPVNSGINEKPLWKKLLPWMALAGILAILALVAILLFLPGKDARLPINQGTVQDEMPGDGFAEESLDDNEYEEATHYTFSEAQLNEYRELLKDPALTFDQIEEMDKWVSDREVAAACNEINPNFVSIVHNYKEIKDLLLKGNIDEALSVNETQGEPLYIVHRWQIHAALDGWVDDQGIMHMYQGESKRKAQEEYQANCDQYKSFLDIWHIHDTGARKLEDRSPHSLTGKHVPDWPGASTTQGTPASQGRNANSGNNTNRRGISRQQTPSDDIEELNE